MITVPIAVVAVMVAVASVVRRSKQVVIGVGVVAGLGVKREWKGKRATKRVQHSTPVTEFTYHVI